MKCGISSESTMFAKTKTIYDHRQPYSTKKSACTLYIKNLDTVLNNKGADQTVWRGAALSEPLLDDQSLLMNNRSFQCDKNKICQAY